MFHAKDNDNSQLGFDSVLLGLWDLCSRQRKDTWLALVRKRFLQKEKKKKLLHVQDGNKKRVGVIFVNGGVGELQGGML